MDYYWDPRVLKVWIEELPWVKGNPKVYVAERRFIDDLHNTWGNSKQGQRYVYNMLWARTLIYGNN